MSLSGGTLTVAVPTGANSDHKFFVEPFTDLTRDGWRVGSGFAGAPAITTSDSDCFGNSLFNDVVCSGARGAVTITTRAGADNVVVVDLRAASQIPGAPPVAAGVCVEGVAFTQVATVTLGGGGDRLSTPGASCSGGTIPAQGFSFHFVAGGGAGNDTMTGTGGADVFNGGSGNDTLQGGQGDDTIAGEADEDDLQGGGGSDTLTGFTGRDTINGGPDADTLDGGDQNDALNSRDGVKDVKVDCGSSDPNTVDTAVVDSVDAGGSAAFLLPGERGGKGSIVRNCESVTAFPIDDGPPGTLLGSRLAIRADGLTKIRIACPRAARVRCRGRASLRDPRRPARVLASASYAIGLGGKARVNLELTATERALLRRRGQALVTTRERRLGVHAPGH